jgi:hypothetical protein
MADINAIPAGLASIVSDFLASRAVDWTCPTAMSGECDTYSSQLVRALSTVDAAASVYAKIVGVGANIDGLDADLANGHTVVLVEWDNWEDESDAYGTFMIDLTAAQFPTLGWTGPRFEQV